MVDRQDIDALLVGALYGELTPADEARLQAHLESHPADRSALDDLKSARQAVRESRVFDTQAEPPQAVSALLLQEAHRRAPRRAAVVDGGTQESWFARLTRSFIMHPAMAAAATLVLVIGVVGGLYLRKGGDQLSRQKSDEAAAPAGVTSATAENTDKGKAGKDQLAASDNEPAAVAAGSGAVVTGTAQAAPSGGDTYNVGLADDRKSLEKAENAPAVVIAKPTAHAHTDGIVVQRPEPQPKELDRAKRFKDDDGEFQHESSGAGGGGRTPSGLAYAGPAATTAAAPPPPPSAQAPAATPSGPAPARVATKTALSRKAAASESDEDAPAKEAAPKAPEDLKWATDAFNQAKVAAGNNDCVTAVNKADAIQQQAPGYYEKNVADDRALKGCKSYLNSLAEQKAVAKKTHAATKAKAAPANADEAPTSKVAPTSTK